VRHEMLGEAIEVIAALFDGDNVNHRGTYFDVESAQLFDRHNTRVPIGVAVSGQQSCTLAGRHADLMIAVEPKPELGEMFDEAGGQGKPRVGQMALCYDPDRDVAVKRAHEQFRWFGMGWKVNADLPGPSSFEAATQFVTPEQVAESLPCGPDVEEHVEKIRPFLDAGFTEVALVQIGADTPGRLHPLGARRAAAGAARALSPTARSSAASRPGSSCSWRQVMRTTCQPAASRRRSRARSCSKAARVAWKA
jgi:G6PDH family F420-dependent oxidoreductase